MIKIRLNVNGKDHNLEIEENWTLLHVIRNSLRLTGTKYGCGTNDCGACKVLIDGEAVNSCAALARKMEGKRIVTIEGISRGKELHPVQEAFVEAGAIQCGFCTPGMVITSVALLNRNPDPTGEEITEVLDGKNGNICRCTGYTKIIEAIQLAGKKMRGEA